MGSYTDHLKRRDKLSLSDYIIKPKPKKQAQNETKTSKNNKEPIITLRKNEPQLILPIPEGLAPPKKKNKPSKLKKILENEHQLCDKLQPYFKLQDAVRGESKTQDVNFDPVGTKEVPNNSDINSKSTQVTQVDDSVNASIGSIEEVISNLMSFNISDKKIEDTSSIFTRNLLSDYDYNEYYKFHTSKESLDRSTLIRSYVDQSIDEELNSYVKNFLSTLSKFQYRLAREQPEKLIRHQRYIGGFKQVLKSLKLGMIKLLFIAPNLVPTITEGGIDDLIRQVLSEARANDVPVIFALSRSGFRKAVKLGTRHSIIGVINYEGAEKMVPKLLKLAQERKFDKDSFISA